MSAVMTLPQLAAAGCAEVWLCRTDDVEIGALTAHAHGLLAPQEWRRAEDFVLAPARLRYLAGRLMLRSVLAAYIGCAPQALRFASNAYGKPVLADSMASAWPLAANLDFNLSHSEQWLALALAHGAVGVDIESEQLDFSWRAMSRLCLADCEQVAMDETPVHLQNRRFIRFWTAKEALLKAHGVGLSVMPYEAAFALHDEGSVDGAVQLLSCAAVGNPLDWRLHQFRLAQRYILTVCAQAAGEQAPPLQVRQRSFDLGSMRALENWPS